MKLNPEIITLCDYASISRDGKLSINGIFDELRIQQFPGGIARAFFVATLRGEIQTNYNLSIITRIDGKELNRLDMTMTTSATGKNNIILEFVNLGFENDGNYEFVVLEGIEEIAKTSLTILSASQEVPQAPKEKKFSLN